MAPASLGSEDVAFAGTKEQIKIFVSSSFYLKTAAKRILSFGNMVRRFCKNPCDDCCHVLKYDVKFIYSMSWLAISWCQILKQQSEEKIISTPYIVFGLNYMLGMSASKESLLDSQIRIVLPALT